MILRVVKWLGVILLIICCLVGLFIYNTFSQFAKFEQGSLSTEFVIDTIPFRYHHTGHLLIDVKVNESEITYPFILDSGASNQVFHNLTDEIELDRGGVGFNLGANNNPYLTRINKINTLQIGAARLQDLYSDVTVLQWNCMEDVYGIIGYNSMRHLVWEIDFTAQRIVIATQLDKDSRDSKAIKIPLTQRRYSAHLTTDMRFTHQSNYFTVAIDLGNNGTLSLSETEIVASGLSFESKKMIGEGGKGLGYQFNNHNRKMKLTLIDSLIFVDGPYTTSQLAVQVSNKSSNLLGLGFFKHYNMTLSWYDNVMLLTPNQSSQDYIPNISGLKSDYSDHEQKVIITGILQDTPASRANLEIGTEIVSINNLVLNTKEDYCKCRASMNDLDSVTLELLHDQESKFITLKKEHVF